MWNYYDFDQNWETFLQVWKSHEVQHSMLLDIEASKLLGFFANYRKGEPLWKYTRTLYWKLKINEIARADADSKNHAFKIKKSLHNFGLNIDVKTFYDKVYISRIASDYNPKPDTIDSFIMPEGSYIFLKSLALCAKILFPDDSVRIDFVNLRRCVVIKEKHIIFDLFGYYFWEHDHKMEYAPTIPDWS